MPKKLYVINLNDEEQRTLLEITRKGKFKARRMKAIIIPSPPPKKLFLTAATNSGG